jgi:hypothetical protein
LAGEIFKRKARKELLVQGQNIGLANERKIQLLPTHATTLTQNRPVASFTRFILAKNYKITYKSKRYYLHSELSHYGPEEALSFPGG